MSVDIFIYDTSCHTLHANLDVTAFDNGGTILDSDTTIAMSSGDWGTTLSWALPSSTSNAYELLIQDPRTTYAPFDINALNGNHTGRIDAVITKLPTSGSISSTTTITTSAQVLAAVSRHTTWTPEEKIAVKLLVETFAHFKNGRYDPQFFLAFQGRWMTVLDRYGIPASLL